MPRKAFQIRRQGDGETLPSRVINSCRGCYRPIPHTKEAYCSERCAGAHQRLRGAA